MRKGFELDLIGTMVIALVGVGILLMFVSGTLRESVNDGFCYLTQKIGISISWCSPLGMSKNTVELEKRDIPDVEALAVQLAGRSIQCWEMAVKPEKKTNVICAELFLNYHPGKLSEENFTKIMEDQGGCEVLQNFMVIDESGSSVEYSGDCGDQDQVSWKIDGNVIESQSFIKIEYDTTSNKIVIKG